MRPHLRPLLPVIALLALSLSTGCGGGGGDGGTSPGPGDTATCSWELTIDGDGTWNGDAATHGYAADFTVFNLSFVHDAGSGTCSGLDGGPAAGELGTYDVNFVFIAGARSWAAGDAVTLTVTSHDDYLEGTVSGACLTVVDQQEVQRTFELTFRSMNVLSDDSCAE